MPLMLWLAGVTAFASWILLGAFYAGTEICLSILGPDGEKWGYLNQVFEAVRVSCLGAIVLTVLLTPVAVWLTRRRFADWNDVR